MRKLILIIFTLSGPAMADDTTLRLGEALAKENCTGCHAITPTDASPLREAPPFRDIAVNYDAGELEDAFNEGVATDHPVMPDWEMTPGQAEALATYIMSLVAYGMKKSELTP